MNWKVYILVVIVALLFTQAYAFQGNMNHKFFKNTAVKNTTLKMHNRTTIINQTLNKTKRIIHPYKWMRMIHYQRFKHGLHLALGTREKFIIKYKAWQKERQKCMSGNCTMYFNVTKDMTLTAINVTITRLQSINSTESQELINNLTTMKSEIENTSNIQELREIYPEVRKTIAEANHLFATHMLVNLAYTYLDYVNELSQNTSNIKMQLNQLISNSSNMTPSEIAHQLRTIRGEIMALGW